MTKAEVYALLDREGMAYQTVEHSAVYTIEEMDALDLPSSEQVLKNLFLRDDKKRNWYLVSLPGHRALDLKALRRSLGSRPLSFAGEADLARLLCLAPGHVTPLAALNDESRTVSVVFDAALTGQTVGVHPLENTATVFLALEDVIRLLQDHGTPVTLCEMNGE